MSKRVFVLIEPPVLHVKPISQMMQARTKRTTGQRLKQYTLEQKLHLPQEDEWSSG